MMLLGSGGSSKAEVNTSILRAIAPKKRQIKRTNGSTITDV